VFLIDSSTCVSILRSRSPRLAERLREVPLDDLAVSAITAAELYHGAAKSREARAETRKVQELLTLVRPIEFGTEAALSYGFIRSFLERGGQVIGPLDMLIAAHALSVEAILVTHNTGEFRRVPGLDVEDWLA